MSPATSTRKRLDQALFDNGLTESREQAKRLIMAGKVDVNGQRARKPSDSIVPEDAIKIQEPERYVSRGGFKLEKALTEFPINTQDAIAAFLARGGSIDRAPMGASSGFTSRELRKAAQGDCAPLTGAFETDSQIQIRAENEQQAALERASYYAS